VLVPWVATLVLAGVAVFVQRRDLNPAHLGIVLVCMIGSIRVSRLDAFFVLSVIVLLGTAVRSAIRGDKQQLKRSGSHVSTLSIAAAVVVVGAISLTASAPRFRCIFIEGKWAPEPEAAEFVQSQHLKGRMLTFFDWGEYAIWHFAPDIKVSIDGRRETVYSDDMMSRHFALYQDKPGAQQLLDQIRPDYIWLPARLPIVSTLRNTGWTEIFAGSKSSILSRHSLSAAKPLPDSGDRARCFPGP
jgi:hypothetical protein